MIEIEDEHSESWAELTQFYYENDDEGNGESYPEAAGTYLFSAECEVHRQRPDFSRSFEGASTSEFEKEYPSLAEGAWIKQRERDFDVRSQLNRNRRGDYHGDNGPWRRDRRRGSYHDNVPWRRDHSRESYDDSSPYSDRPRYTNRSAETSPFRSPLNRTKRFGSGDMDNGNNLRFGSHRRGDGRPNSSNRVNNNTRYFPIRQEQSCRRLYSPTQGENETNNRNKVVAEESCRRLYSPTQGEDETNNRISLLTKEDVKMARREKDIAYGRNTDDYRTYIQVVPKHSRCKDRRVHPRTPDKFEGCSRKSWDGQVKVWKLSFHAWAANYYSTGSKGDSSQKSSYSKATTSTSEHTRVKEQDTKLVLAEDESKERDDDTFLDAVDYMLLVGNQGDQ